MSNDMKKIFEKILDQLVTYHSGDNFYMVFM